LQQALKSFIDNKLIKHVILLIVVINAFLFIVEGSEFLTSKLHITNINFYHKLILYIFGIEMTIKLIAYDKKYFSIPWNLVDCIVVAAALLGVVFNMPFVAIIAIFRTLKLAELSPRLLKIVEAFFLALPHLTAVILLILLIYYIYGVIGFELYRYIDPNHFGTFSGTILTLTQLTLLDNWADVARPLMTGHAYSWVYFISFTFLVAFSAINLIVGVFVDAVQQKSAELHAERVRSRGKLFQTLHDLKIHISDLEAYIEKIETKITMEEKLLRKPTTKLKKRRS
jgi:voltage-gated sodium channel